MATHSTLRISSRCHLQKENLYQKSHIKILLLNQLHLYIIGIILFLKKKTQNITATFFLQKTHYLWLD